MEKSGKEKLAIFWMRRDLRLADNTALNRALEREERVLPIFIFDDQILDELTLDDARVSFIYENLLSLNKELQKMNSSIKIFKGNPFGIWQQIVSDYTITAVYTNKDYEPYARQRDQKISDFLINQGIDFYSFKDQVIFEEDEILKNDGKPYHVFTPYKNKWLALFQRVKPTTSNAFSRLHKNKYEFPGLDQLGFLKSSLRVKDYDLSQADRYAETRDYPGFDGTTNLGPHLRFGTVSVRTIIEQLNDSHSILLSELIWREFFMQILFHYPRVVHENFNKKYDGVAWRNNQQDFEKWCTGKTGYPLVDAGMRELNATGRMHNRVRMIAAGFLCKHLLIDWRWGESFFAKKLLDYELSSNNGNWQWAAGTGCDAAPYFRIFNPEAQMNKFDRDRIYIKKWIPEYETPAYANPMVDHKEARVRALDTYRIGVAASN